MSLVVLLCMRSTIPDNLIYTILSLSHHPSSNSVTGEQQAENGYGFIPRQRAALTRSVIGYLTALTTADVLP